MLTQIVRCQSAFPRLLKRLHLMLMSLMLAACSIPVRDYTSQKPEMDLRDFMQGDLQAWGMFQDWRGQVKRRFHVDIHAEWEGNVGVLREDFSYDDGEQQQRVWTITHLGDGNYKGSAEDVIGTAKGESAGNALRWQYVLRLVVGNKTYDVNFDDWMFLVDEETLINRAKVTKFGVKVGEVTLFMRRNG